MGITLMLVALASVLYVDALELVAKRDEAPTPLKGGRKEKADGLGVEIVLPATT